MYLFASLFYFHLTLLKELAKQDVITSDNVSVMVDAIIYYKVVDAEKAVLNVENGDRVLTLLF